MFFVEFPCLDSFRKPERGVQRDLVGVGSVDTYRYLDTRLP